jgi:hypothetical protein
MEAQVAIDALPKEDFRAIAEQEISQPGPCDAADLPPTGGDEGVRTGTKRAADEDVEQLRAKQPAEVVDAKASLAPRIALASTGEAPHPSDPASQAAAEDYQHGLPPIDWTRSWYEILGVARNAQPITNKAAYKRLNALYHPHKAGAEQTSTMQRINHIYSILSSSVTRKAYNKNPQDFPFPGNTWRADAEAPEGCAAADGEPPDLSARGDASKDEPDLTQAFTLRWEPVNVAAVEKALMLAAIRSVRMEHYDCFEILLSIRKRAIKVRRGTGSIPVVERRSQSVGNLQNRLCSGIRGLDPAKLPGPIRAELERGVPSELAGLSVFAFSKPIRYLCRSGLNVSEIDIVNAVYSVFCEICMVPEVVRRYRDDRDNVLREVGAWLQDKSGTSITRDAVKELFISLGFGGSVWTWMQEHLPEPVELDGDWGT